MRSLILITILTVILSNAQKDVDKSKTSFSDSIRTFQLKLLYHTGSHLSRHLVMAPFSVWALLAVLAEGTAGSTNQELRKYIGKTGNRNYSHESFANVTKFFKESNSVTVERTSSLFYDNKIIINPDYAREMTMYYGTNMQSIDASQPQIAASQINLYFSTATHNRIRQVVTSDDLRDARVILTETLYFKGRWAKPFNASTTTEENFHNDAGEMTGRVNLMYQRTPLGFSNLEKLGGHVIELPYADDKFAMLVMLPYRGISIVDLYLNLKDVPFSEVFRRLAEDKINYGTEDVDVWLPRFKINTDASLVIPIANSGVHQIFTKEADFSRMTNDHMYVTNIIHKAEIEVTEEGTVASAVGGALLSHRTAVPKFKADRPFLFIILEKASETILFSGIYSEPSLF